MPTQLSLNIGIIEFLEKVIANFWLTDKQRVEIITKVDKAVALTESVFGQRYNGSRIITKNDAVADAWAEAGTAIRTYLPNEYYGELLQNKSDAWRNPHKWSEEELEAMGIQIQQIKAHIRNITNGINRLKNKPLGGTY